MSLEEPWQGAARPPAGEARDVAEIKPLSLRRNFAWTLVGTAVYLGSQMAMLSVLAKLTTKEAVGQFSLGQALCAPVVMFTNLQLRAIQATDARDEFRFGDYLRLRLIGTALAFATIAYLAFSGHDGTQRALVVLAIGGAKCVESISDVIFGLWQKYERLDLIAKSYLIKGPASLLALAIVVYLTRNVVWATVALLVVWSGLLLTYDCYFARRLSRLHPAPPRPADDTRSPYRILWHLAWLALPLGLVGLLDSLNLNMPRYVIQHVLGDAGLGFFAVISAFMVVGTSVVMALVQSSSPRLARYYVQDPPAFRKLLWRLLQIALAMGVAGVACAALFGRPVLALVATPEYAAHNDALIWLMVAAGLGYVARFLIASMLAARRLRAQAPLYAAALGVIAWLSHALVPRWGLVGAAWAICAAMGVLLVGAAVINLLALRARGEEPMSEAVPEAETPLPQAGEQP